MPVFLFFLPNVCLIPFGALRLEALSYVYWEKPSLDILKVVGEGLTGVLSLQSWEVQLLLCYDSGHVFELGVQCWISMLGSRPAETPGNCQLQANIKNKPCCRGWCCGWSNAVFPL